MTRVTVSRPDSEDRRKVLVDGRPVGLIQPSYGAGRKNRLWRVIRPMGRVGPDWMSRGLEPSTDCLASGLWFKDLTFDPGYRLDLAIQFAREYPDWPVQRWVAMSGLAGGYLPDYVACCDSRETACDDLRELFGFGGRIARVLGRDGYTGLPGGMGAEYCEVSPCECSACGECTTGNVDDWDCEDCRD